MTHDLIDLDQCAAMLGQTLGFVAHLARGGFLPPQGARVNGRMRSTVAPVVAFGVRSRGIREDSSSPTAIGGASMSWQEAGSTCSIARRARATHPRTEAQADDLVRREAGYANQGMFVNEKAKLRRAALRTSDERKRSSTLGT